MIMKHLSCIGLSSLSYIKTPGILSKKCGKHLFMLKYIYYKITIISNYHETSVAGVLRTW